MPPRPTTTFITRKVDIPSSPEDSDNDDNDSSFFPGGPRASNVGSQIRSGGPPSSMGGSSAGGGGSGTASNGAPLPALPSALMNALAREPPPPSRGPSSIGTNLGGGGGLSSGRTSLSFNRHWDREQHCTSFTTPRLARPDPTISSSSFHNSFFSIPRLLPN
ncbi:hypothetical protein P7C70_g9232, partial [Phenoliferia sp. Uapishka_3]